MHGPGMHKLYSTCRTRDTIFPELMFLNWLIYYSSIIIYYSNIIIRGCTYHAILLLLLTT
jgi:hypothetical protein